MVTTSLTTHRSCSCLQSLHQEVHSLEQYEEIVIKPKQGQGQHKHSSPCRWSVTCASGEVRRESQCKLRLLTGGGPLDLRGLFGLGLLGWVTLAPD